MRGTPRKTRCPTVQDYRTDLIISASNLRTREAIVSSLAILWKSFIKPRKFKVKEILPISEGYAV